VDDLTPFLSGGREALTCKRNIRSLDLIGDNFMRTFLCSLSYCICELKIMPQVWRPRSHLSLWRQMVVDENLRLHLGFGLNSKALWILNPDMSMVTGVLQRQVCVRFQACGLCHIIEFRSRQIPVGSLVRVKGKDRWSLKFCLKLNQLLILYSGRLLSTQLPHNHWRWWPKESCPANSPSNYTTG